MRVLSSMTAFAAAALSFAGAASAAALDRRSSTPKCEALYEHPQVITNENVRDDIGWCLEQFAQRQETSTSAWTCTGQSNEFRLKWTLTTSEPMHGRMTCMNALFNYMAYYIGQPTGNNNEISYSSGYCSVSEGGQMNECDLSYAFES